MGATHSGQQELMHQLRHEIFSPLAAIRSALMLVAVRCDDPAIHEYLNLAESQLQEIAQVLHRARP